MYNTVESYSTFVCFEHIFYVPEFIPFNWTATQNLNDKSVFEVNTDWSDPT
jgi:hypothetical protein